MNESQKNSHIIAWIILILIIIFILAGIGYIIYSLGVFDTDPKFTKSILMCGEKDVEFDVSSCQYYFNDSKYWTYVKFNLDNSNLQLSNAFAVFYLENGKLRTKQLDKIQSGQQNILIKLKEIPDTVGFLGVIWEEKLNCKTKFFNCNEIDMPQEDIVPTITNVSEINNTITQSNNASSQEDETGVTQSQSPTAPPSLPPSLLN